MALTRQQQDDLIALIRRKGYRVRGRGGFLDRYSIGDDRCLEEMTQEQWEYAMAWLGQREDVGGKT